MIICSQQNSNWKQYPPKGDEITIRSEIETNRVGEFLYEVYLDGTDQMGLFEAKGFVVARDQSSFFWFLKLYDGYYGKRAGEAYIYESRTFTQYYMDGIYYKVGGGTGEEESGKWGLKNPYVTANSASMAQNGNDSECKFDYKLDYEAKLA